MRSVVRALCLRCLISTALLRGLQLAVCNCNLAKLHLAPMPSVFTVPVTNATHWSAKASTNRAFDADTDRWLDDGGRVSRRTWQRDDPEESAT